MSRQRVCKEQYSLDFGDELGWFDSDLIILTTVFSIFFRCGFSFFNRYAGNHIFDFGVFLDHNYRLATIIICVGNGLIFTSLVVLPVWLQVDYGMPILQAGMMVAIGSGVAAVLSPLIGRYLKARSYFTAGLLSLSFTAASFFMMSQFTLDSTTEQLFSARIVAGLGLALFSVPLTALSLMTINNSAIVNANAINMCFRVVSSNICISLGFVALSRQKDIAYARQISDIDRFTIVNFASTPFTEMGFINRLADTQAMVAIFAITGLIL